MEPVPSDGVVTAGIGLPAPGGHRTAAPVETASASPRRRVLVVDDDPFWLRAVQLILQLDHDVRTAGSGLEALAAMNAAAPDLVVLGWPLPGPNGGSIGQAVQSRDAGLPIVVVSGEAPSAIDAAAARDRPRKPIDAQRLRDDVALQLAGTRVSRTPRSPRTRVYGDAGRSRSRARRA